MDTGLPPHDWLGNGTAKIDNRHAIMIYFGIYGQNQHASGIVGDYQCVEQIEFKFVGLDNYADGDQVLSYAKDGIQIDITAPIMETRSVEL